MTPEIAFNQNNSLGEGCTWDERTQTIWWIDINPGHLHQLDPATGMHNRYEIGQMIGAFAFREQGGMLLAVESGFAFYDPETGRLDPIVDPEPGKPDNRFNDGKVDPSGSFYGGTMGKVIRDELGAFYRLNRDMSVEKQFDGVTVSNGLCWNSAETTMYYIDTPTLKVDAFDFDPATGIASNRRTAFTIPEAAGFPDGMTIDTEDKLWIAHYGGSAVRRWDPETGNEIATINLPVSKATCCTFGGPDFSTLYITTAAQGTSLDEEPLAGALFKVETKFQGRRTYRFKA